MTSSDSSPRPEALARLLQQQSGYLEVLGATAPFGLYVDTVEQGCIFTNARFQEIFDLTLEETMGFGWVKRIHRDDLARMEAEVAHFHQTLEPAHVDYRVVRGNGDVRWVNARVTALLDSHGAHQGSVVSIEDQTEVRSLKQRLEASQRVEAIGRLAGSVAHDFNNLLTVIMGSSSLIGLDCGGRPGVQANLQMIDTASEQARMLTEQLLTLSGKQVIMPRPFPLDDELERLRPILLRSLVEGVELAFNLEAGRGLVVLDPRQLCQIIVNLVVNARDAVAPKGTVTIATEILHSGADVADRDVTVSDWIRLSVHDDGCGISEEDQKHMFEFFFTTKGEGRGTGLGLAIVHEIVLRARGHLEVRSSPGKGTEISVYLPLDGADASPMRREMENLDQLKGTGRLLFVEDHPGARLTTGHLLTAHGYTVRVSSGVQGALETWKSDGPFDALVTDLMLSDGTGTELVRLLGDALKGVPILFMSGYAGAVIEELELDQPQRWFLPKPAKPADLLGKIKEILASARNEKRSCT